MLAIKGSGAEDDVIMDMRLVRMRCHHIGMVSLQEPRSQLTADLIGFFRRDFSGFKRLAKLICNDFAVPVSLRQMQISASHQRKLIGGSFPVTGIRGHQLPAFRLRRIHSIFNTISQRLGSIIALGNVHGDQSGRCHSRSSIKKAAARFNLAAIAQRYS